MVGTMVSCPVMATIQTISGVGTGSHSKLRETDESPSWKLRNWDLSSGLLQAGVPTTARSWLLGTPRSWVLKMSPCSPRDQTGWFPSAAAGFSGHPTWCGWTLQLTGTVSGQREWFTLACWEESLSLPPQHWPSCCASLNLSFPF